MPIPFNQLPIGDGRGPNGDRVPFFVDRQVLDSARDDGIEWKFHDARFIEEAVSDPDAIFEGLRRPNHSTGLCYSVRPTRDPDDEDDEDDADGPPVYGRVFLAFVQLAEMGYVVFDWEWRAEGEEPGHPEGADKDFVRLIWQRP